MLARIPRLLGCCVSSRRHRRRSSPTITRHDRRVPESEGKGGQFFARRFGYAVLPTFGKGGIVVGGVHGTGRVHVKSQHARSTSMTQLTVGWQLGGRPAAKSSSSKTSGRSTNLAAAPSNSAPRSTAVAIAAGASAQVVTGGSSASASDTQQHSKNGAKYNNGMAVFTVA